MHAGGDQAFLVTMATPITIPVKRVDAGAGRAAELLRDGWKKQTTIGEPRLTEIAENYRSLGYEVLVESYRATNDSGGGCSTCFEAGDELGQVHGTVYIRKPQGTDAGAVSDDDLF